TRRDGRPRPSSRAQLGNFHVLVRNVEELEHDFSHALKLTRNFGLYPMSSPRRARFSAASRMRTWWPLAPATDVIPRSAATRNLLYSLLDSVFAFRNPGAHFTRWPSPGLWRRCRARR